MLKMSDRLRWRDWRGGKCIYRRSHTCRIGRHEGWELGFRVTAEQAQKH